MTNKIKRIKQIQVTQIKKENIICENPECRHKFRLGEGAIKHKTANGFNYRCNNLLCNPKTTF